MTTPAHIVYENLPIIHRPDWRAKAKRNMVIPEEKLKLPVMYLLLDHTGTDPCTDLDACEKKVRELQQISFQDKKLNDIQYNWVIGGDGNVFEGRGWHWRPPLNPDAPEYFDQSMEILFVGNYENEPIPSNVMESYSNVIKMFWDKGVLHRESKSRPNMLRRAEWGARKPRFREMMMTPVDKVILNYYSRTRTCEENVDCCKMIRFIQDIHMDKKNYRDIAYNFLIGGNGIVYKGRGWTTNCERTKGKYKMYNGKCHEICLLGDWREKDPPLIMIDTFKKLVAYGIRKGFIERTYEIIERKDGIVIPPKTMDADIVNSVTETPVLQNPPM